MNKEDFRKAFLAAAKDCGLTDKALSELAEQGAAAIGDDASEETIKAQATLYANIAKLMQGEVTRKIQAIKPQPAPAPKPEGGDDTGKPQPAPKPAPAPSPDKGGQPGPMEELMKQMQAQLEVLTKAHADAEAAKAEQARQALVTAAAEKAGIDAGWLKIVDTSKITSEADADALMSSVKQQMVNNNLQPKGGGGVQGSGAEADKADAEAWAKSLPDA